MTQSELQISIKIVEAYQTRRSHYLCKTISFSFKQIEDHEQKIALRLKKLSTKAAHLIEKFSLIVEITAQRNKMTSCDFNLFRMFHVNELIHSNFFAHLLNPNGDHGQNHLFINIFLDMLGITRNHDHESWIVTAEKGRVDILLKRVHPHAVVVIENKSNYAIDQDHQLYRYWYQEIYKTICQTHLGEEYTLNPPACRYQIIYLTPEHWKVPTNNSLVKPPNWEDNLPVMVPIQPRTLLIRDFIIEWLKQSLFKLPSENHRMVQYLQQYIEFWT